ncbi:MAG: SpoIIE family protein phosphatase [bacterium]|nr:SpoIIE family protein phosphatase [bacterium]
MTDDRSRTHLEPEALERILDVTRRLAAPIDLEAMLDQVIEAARAVLDAERGSVFLYDKTRDELVTSVATGVEPLRLPADRGIVGECAQNRTAINVPDCYADPRFNQEIDKQTGYRSRCLLTIPLVGYAGELVGVLQLLNKSGGTFDARDESIATTLAAQCAVALQRAKMVGELVAKEKMERELAVAREIQVDMLPKSMPQVPGYDVAGACRPADETGGDTFDVLRRGDDGLIVLLGDATGHGIGPALSVTQVRSMLRIAMRIGAGLDDTYSQIDAQLSDDLADNRFVTAFLGLLDLNRHRIDYHSGGQGPLLHFHAASGECDWHKATTLPMGMIAGIPMKPPATMELAPGDIVGLMTDGIFEYENPAGEQFGEARIEELVRASHDAPMQQLVGTVFAAVDAFADAAPQADDMTVVLLRRAAGA